MEFIKKLKNDPHMEVLAEVAVSGLAAGLYCKINPKADYERSFFLGMMTAILSRIIMVERRTAAKVNA